MSRRSPSRVTSHVRALPTYTQAVPPAPHIRAHAAPVKGQTPALRTLAFSKSHQQAPATCRCTDSPQKLPLSALHRTEPTLSRHRCGASNQTSLPHTARPLRQQLHLSVGSGSLGDWVASGVCQLLWTRTSPHKAALSWQRTTSKNSSSTFKRNQRSTSGRGAAAAVS